MMSIQSLTWLTAFLATTATVSALPIEEKRAVSDWVTATIDGQVVSWINEYDGVPATGATWVTATINGDVVSWINDWTGLPTPAAATTTAATVPATTAAPVPTSTVAPAPTSPVAPVPTTTVAPAPTSSVVTPPVSTPDSASGCKDVHIFLGKGWNEPYPGRQGKLAGAICSGIESCDYEDIIFYNAEGSDFCSAQNEGVHNGLAQMTAYAERCPDSKLVVTGYSQGAGIVGDILGGSDSECTGYAGGLDPSTSPGNKISAALVFGDVRHVADQSYNWLSGSGASSGSPRAGESLERMNKFSNVLRSYCDKADPQCAATGSGPFDIEYHLNYFELYTEEAAGWVKSKLGY